MSVGSESAADPVCTMAGFDAASMDSGSHDPVSTMAGFATAAMGSGTGALTDPVCAMAGFANRSKRRT